MEIESFSHKALRRFFETGNRRGLDGQLVVFIAAAPSTEQLKAPPNYGAHELTGDRAGTWSLTVTRNWRMTFRLNDTGAIIELDLEDYH